MRQQAHEGSMSTLPSAAGNPAENSRGMEQGIEEIMGLFEGNRAGAGTYSSPRTGSE
jgi:hypothetical protein